MITGGSYLGLGIGTFMLESFSEEKSTQGIILCNLGNQAADTALTISDGSGNLVLQTTTKYKTVLLLFSSADIVKGATYTVTVGTYTTTVAAG